MDGFWSGFGVGVLAGLTAVAFVGNLAMGMVDATCKRQGWQGQACQCRLLEKDEATK